MFSVSTIVVKFDASYWISGTIKSANNFPDKFEFVFSESSIIFSKFPFPYLSNADLPFIANLIFPLHSLYFLPFCNINSSKLSSVIVYLILSTIFVLSVIVFVIFEAISPST